MLAPAVALVALALTAPPAAAFCPGPEVTYDAGPTDRGARLTITGTGFGDECLDTGPLAPGVGRLGDPLTGIEIYLVQGDDAALVAAGSADDAYEIAVDVVIPSVLAPGEASLSVIAPGFDGEIVSVEQEPLVISDAPADPDADAIVTFGPDAQPVEVVPPVAAGPADQADPTAPAAALIESGEANEGWLALGVALLVLIAGAALAVFAWDRSRRPTPTTTSDPTDPDGDD